MDSPLLVKPDTLLSSRLAVSIAFAVIDLPLGRPNGGVHHQVIAGPVAEPLVMAELMDPQDIFLVGSKSHHHQ